LRIHAHELRIHARKLLVYPVKSRVNDLVDNFPDVLLQFVSTGGVRCAVDDVELVNEIGGLLRVRGGSENRAAVVLQDFQPVGDIGGVIRAGLKRQLKIGTEERCSQCNFRSRSRWRTSAARL